MKSAADPGVPLAHYRDHDAGVRLTCLDCMDRRDLPLEPVIRRLRARGVGDSGTGIKAVASYVTAPCPRGGGRRFDTSPAFPVIPKGQGWRVGRISAKGVSGRHAGREKYSHPPRLQGHAPARGAALHGRPGGHLR